MFKRFREEKEKMPKFMVPVSGKLVVEAEDKDKAKEIVQGMLAQKQPWLEADNYGTTRVFEPEDISAESLLSH